MKFIRYQYANDVARYGWVYQDLIGPVEGSLFHEYRRLEANIPLDRVKLLPSAYPGKIICVLHNYPDHALALGDEIPDIPRCYYKPQNTLIGSGDRILLPPQSRQVEHEANLGIVIGKKGRWISTSDAMSYVFGYTVANDITARDIVRRDNSVDRGKGFDTFCPVGPWIETDLDSADTMITCRVNQELRQMVSTKEMIFSIPQLITFISSFMTLMPGDLILSGSPGGMEAVKSGDLVEANIEGIGTLVNSVEEDQPGAISG
jgi:2-keto-4-pentenoate hydratase/2-oxohepta-3-ene-1,7-dioic acid hydratase in catechol pathway